MKNQSVSDFVAATMDAVLKSAEHKALFNTQYKYAEETMCAKHSKMDSCEADDNAAKKSKDSSKDSSSADDQAAKAKKDSKDSSSADDNAAKKSKDSKDSSKDSSSADDQNHFGGGMLPDDRDNGEYDKHFADNNDAKKSKDSSKDSSKADDNAGDASDEKSSTAFDVAIDSLLTASAALDSVGLGRGSALSLKLASLVVDAKKKDKESKKSKKDSKDSNSAKDKKKDSSKDSHSAKDKKDSKKSDSKSSSKKSDSKSSKK